MDGSIVFARLRQCAPHLRRLLPRAHPTPYPKRHLNRFRRFCTAHGRRPHYYTMGRPSPPQNCHSAWGIWTPFKYMLHWTHPTQLPKQHLDLFNLFCTAHGRVSIHHNGLPLSSSKLPLCMGDLDPI